MARPVRSTSSVCREPCHSRLKCAVLRDGAVHQDCCGLPVTIARSGGRPRGRHSRRSGRADAGADARCPGTGSATAATSRRSTVQPLDRVLDRPHVAAVPGRRPREHFVPRPPANAVGAAGQLQPPLAIAVTGGDGHPTYWMWSKNIARHRRRRRESAPRACHVFRSGLRHGDPRAHVLAAGASMPASVPPLPTAPREACRGRAAQLAVQNRPRDYGRARLRPSPHR